MTTTTAYPSRDQGLERYYRIKAEFWEHFYSLSFGQRVSIMWSETLYIVVFLCGWIAFSLYVRYGHFMTAEIFSSSAWAQGTSPSTGLAAGMSEQMYKYILWLIINLALVLVMLGCVGHMLFAKRKNQWVAKTGTFLLGFLSKSVGALML